MGDKTLTASKSIKRMIKAHRGQSRVGFLSRTLSGKHWWDRLSSLIEVLSRHHLGLDDVAEGQVRAQGGVRNSGAMAGRSDKGPLVTTGGDGLTTRRSDVDATRL